MITMMSIKEKSLKMLIFGVKIPQWTQRKEAREVISEAYDVQIARNIRLYTDSAEWIYTAGDLGLIRDDDNIIIMLTREVTRAGNIFQRYQERYHSQKTRPGRFDFGFQVDETKIDPLFNSHLRK